MDWNDLKYCTHVAREGSTLAAARALDISQTTVMRRIAALEDALGYELFEKRRAGYVPTDALKALLPRLDAIEVAHTAFEHEAAHTGRSLKGTVRLTASELMVAQFLSSALGAFSAEYPDIRIELFTTDRFLDLSRGEADIALRAGDPPTEASLFGRCIVPSDIWHVCCSRAYAEKHGVPRNLDDLKHHSVVFVLDGQFRGPVSDWVEANIPQERIIFRYNSLMTIYMSLKAGLGVSPCPAALSAVDPDLVRCLQLPIDTGKGLWLLAPERLKKTRHVRILLDFLATRLLSAIRAGETRLAADS
jgi:DNA-binding transcriptional LysR family regulator